MEVTLQTTLFPKSNVHILTIFPEDYSSEDIDKIFPTECGMDPYDQRTKDSVAQIPVNELIERVHNVGGICIAGHVNSDKGVRTLFRDFNVRQLETKLRIEKLKSRAAQRELNPKESTMLNELEARVGQLEDDMQNRYLQFLANHDFDAVEVQKSSDFYFYSGIHTDVLGIRPIPCVIGSDAHNLQDIGLKGHTTYIKMQSPSFRYLKRALRDPATRIRYEDTVPRDRVPRILGIRFGGGFFKAQTVGFSDNLTCLIGGRGSGKSATIEALRYIFEHEIANLTSEKLKDIKDRRSFTLQDTTVEVLYGDHTGDKFVLRRDFGASMTECFSTDGQKLSQIDVATASNLDVKVYGWGEIEELARNKRDQLALIDGFIDNIQSMKDTVRRKMRDLEGNTQEIVSLARDIEELLPKIEELPQKRETLSRISTKEIDEIFEGHDHNQSAKAEFDRFNRSFNDLQQMFPTDENDKPIDLKQKITDAVKNIGENLASYDWIDAFQKDVVNQAQIIQNAYNVLIKEFEKLSTLTSTQVEVVESERTAIEQSLSTKMAESGLDDDFAKLMRRRQQLSSDVAELSGYENDIKSKADQINTLFQTRREQLIPSLDEAKQVVTRCRKEKIVEINRELHRLNSAVKVTLELRPQQDKEIFRLRLGAPEDNAPDGILKGINLRFKRDDFAGLYASLHTPKSFVQAILAPGDYSALRASIEKNGETHEVINEDRAKSVAKHLSPYMEDNNQYFDPRKLNQLLNLEHLEIEDFPVIMLDSKPIEDLSPGQRCSTLIPIILLESTSPLIIDQPEDNLDNKLVFDLVVDILRNLKQKRQIIVATHNPNIPVSGDAEQIVVYETVSRDEGRIPHQGAVDDEEIIKDIKAIMEGSEDAFRIRAEKYGYRLSSDID